MILIRTINLQRYTLSYIYIHSVNTSDPRLNRGLYFVYFNRMKNFLIYKNNAS
jgi:hypothetical protein